MENISNAQIQASIQRAQAEGGMAAAELYGAAATGKADEEMKSADETAEPQETIEIQGTQPEDSGRRGVDEQAPAGHGQAAGQEDSIEIEQEMPSKEEILNQGGPVPEDSLRTAEAIVKQQIQDPEKARELSRTKPLGEPKLLDLRLEESIKMMDIHDLMSCKPLPPVMDDAFSLPEGDVPL